MPVTKKDIEELKKKLVEKAEQKEIRKEYKKLQFRLKHPFLSKFVGDKD